MVRRGRLVAYRAFAAGAGLLGLSLVVGAEPVGPASDERALIEQIGKSIASDKVQFGKAPNNVLGAEIVLPFRGASITLLRTSSFVREDGSISWRGIVKETGERAALMVWGNAVLAGYFAYDGTIFAIENLGGGLQAFAEIGREMVLPDHPSPTVARDGAPMPSRKVAGKSRVSSREPAVAAFADGDRQALEAKTISIDVMMFY